MRNQNFNESRQRVATKGIWTSVFWERETPKSNMAKCNKCEYVFDVDLELEDNFSNYCCPNCRAFEEWGEE